MLVEEGVMRIHDEERRLLAKIHRSPSRLYVLDVDIARPVCFAAHATEDTWLWHAHFGHINFGALRKMGREGGPRRPSLRRLPHRQAPTDTVPAAHALTFNQGAAAATWGPLRTHHATNT